MSKKCSKKVPKKESQQSACCSYDFTLFDETSEQEIRKLLNEITKKYCFQLEKGEETGKLHFQGRFSLKIKKRKSEAIKLLAKKWQKFHLSITSKENKGNDFYVMKEDTRIEGPYTNLNETYIPEDIRKIKQLYPWQEKLVNILSTYNERDVDIIYEEKGCVGKSTISRYMMLFKEAELLPFCNDYKDIMRMAYDVGPKKCYLIDMPRAISKDKLFQFFSAIETLKSGYCYDDRYKFQRRIFDRPRICIFTNSKPDTSLLSKDMWKIWTIQNNDLVLYTDEPEFISETKVIGKKQKKVYSSSESSNDESSDEE